jgi:4'-phosphopantetheinyl transferase
VTDLLSLAPGEVDVWLAVPEAVTDPGTLAACAALMNPEEAGRQARFVFERHRHQFLVARALVRTTLSRYAAVAPADWRFTANQWGRPDIDPGHGCGDLVFNLSHTDGLVAVAVARGAELGVDVEDTRRNSHTDSIAEHFFAPSEVAALRALPPERQHRRFFELWTLKEAYIKARGMGLAISLHSFAYALERGISIRVDPAIGDVADGWQFFADDPNDRHRLALAARFASGAALRARVRAADLAERTGQ